MVDLIQKTEAVLHAAAVRVRALIAQRADELGQQVVMRAVDLHAVKPRRLHAARRLGKQLAYPVDILDGHLLGHQSRIGVCDGRRPQNPCMLRIGLAPRPAMDDLHDDLSPCRMHGRHHRPVRIDQPVGVDAQLVFTRLLVAGDVGVAGDDRPHPALGKLAPGALHRGRGPAVSRRQTHIGSRTDKVVAHCKRADTGRGKGIERSHGRLLARRENLRG